MPRPLRSPHLRRLVQAVVAVVPLAAFLGTVWMNVHLDEQARDLDHHMPCSSDTDAACRFGFVR